MYGEDSPVASLRLKPASVGQRTESLRKENVKMLNGMLSGVVEHLSQMGQGTQFNSHTFMA